MSRPVQVPLIDGRRVGVRLVGAADGWTVIWNHGGLVCGLDADLLAAAADRCGARVIAIDRPGIGASDRAALDSVAEWAGTVARVADHLGVQRFAVAGWSGGGPYALACAAAMPDRVRRVAGIASIAPLQRPGDLTAMGSWFDRILVASANWTPWLCAGLLEVARRAPDGYLRLELRRTLRCSGHPVDERALRILIDAVRQATGRGVGGMVDEYRRYYGHWGFSLGEVDQPVTLWQGDQDVAVPIEHARRLASGLPNATVNLVGGAGHGLPVHLAGQILQDLAPGPGN